MAVNNSISAPAPAQQTNELRCTYKAGDENVTLSPALVKSFLVTGNAEYVTTQEIGMFINLCKYQKLNPFLREAYLIKWGKSDAANLVVGKAAFESRAERNPKYQGYDAGIVIQKQDGTLEYRKGTLVIPGETLIGGWAEVYVEGRVKPVYMAVSLSEYSTGQATWKNKPATMIRKVAKMQALREAFPNALNGMYTAEELGQTESELPTQPVDMSQPVEEPVVQPTVQPQIVDVEPEVLDGSDLL